MNILLDNIIFSLQHTGGISVYWSELIKGITRQGLPLTCIERPTASVNLQRHPLDLSHASIRKDSVLPLRAARYLPIILPRATGLVFHSSYYRPIIAQGAATVVTVHDFTYERYCSGLKHFIHTWQKRIALQQADIIICVSENTRRDLHSIYPHIDQKRIRVVPQGAGEVYQPLAEPAPGQRELILFVGDRSPYKNFPLAVDAVAKMPGKTLAIVSGKPLTRDEQRLLDVKLPGRHHYWPDISDAELNRLYNMAYALLYPSSYEGFGIPPLEAMQAGCPVVAVQAASLPEVCGDAALLAESPTTENFVALLQQLEDKSCRELWQQKGFRQAAKFSWAKMCHETLACYEEALASTDRRNNQ